MADAVISAATEEAVRPLLDSIATQLGYIWNYKTNFDNLKKQVQKLQDRRVALEHSITEARCQGEEIEQHVLIWLDSAEKINEEVTKIIDDNNRANMLCFKNVCPDLKKRYQHSKKASVKAMEVSELEKEGKFDKVSYRTPPKETWHPSSKPFEDFESRRSTVENVLNELRKPNVNMVGVYGMGGIGKTTLAKEVGKQAEEQRLFDAVVFVEVSEKPDTRKIQGAIADKLGLEFREETESGRARKLCERLKKESKILLILDNIWKGLDLEIVGIPFGNEHRDCKLLLTARGIEILSNDMDCQNNFHVGNLDEKEAWDLFKTVAGACIDQHNLQSLALDVAKRCGGLPIAIVTIAKALKDKQELEWKNALRELMRPSSENFVGSVTAEAYSCIRLSYNQLISDELKSTFLLCSIMGFTSDASIEELLRYGTGLSLFRTVYTMEESRDKVGTLVKKLKDSSLLLDTSDSERFSMHDVVRDVGRAIALKDHNKFTVINGVIPREWKDKNILKQCTSISLHDITELPDKELDCPLLQFLYMKGKNENSKIPDNFFIGMPNLRVLHLIKMELSPHPLSLRCLVNLQTLCLNCSWLRDIGFITNIKDLEILVLSCTIEQLPTEIGQLTQLRVLDLSKCYRLEIVPPSIISKLTQLEELYLDYGFDKWHVEGLNNESGNASLDELKHLSQLTTMQLCIRDHKMVPKGLFSQQLQRYNICIGSIDRWNCRSRYGTSKTLKLKSDDRIVLEDGVVAQLKGIEELCIDGRQCVKNALYELDSDGFPQLRHFDIRNNPDLVYIVDSSKKWELPCDAFPLLETLSVTNLIILEKICHGQLTPNSFCRLKTVNVNGCDNLKNLFSLSIAKHLSQLQDISVSNCKNMEDIFTIGRRNDINSNEEIDRIVLDRLQSLSLSKLPKLRSFCSEEEVFASTSNEIILEDTPMPLFDGKVQLPNLKTLNLHQVNFEKIWHHQLPIMSPCFQNLTHLSIWSCHNLKHLFSSSTLGSFVQLQDMTIRKCKVLEAIIRIDELGNNVEHPSLKKLWIEGCPEMKAFIFNDKVSFPNLEEIRISNMINLEMIWQNQLTKDSMNAQHCQKLCKVDINSCKSLKKLFPPSIARNLFHLKDLSVERCGIEEIVAKEGAEDAAAMTFVFPQLTSLTLVDLQELKCFYPGIHGAEDAVAMTFVFPQLTCLKLQDVQELKCFYHGIHTIEWPVLKELNLIGCDKIDHSFALELFAFQKNIPEDQLDIPVFSNLEKLSLEGNRNGSRMIFQSQFPEILFPKLQHLEIKNLDDQPAYLPLGIFQRSHNLESLSLEGGSNKEIFWFEVVGKHTLTKKLSISHFENLEQIWKQDSKVDVILQNLEELHVSWCDSLVTFIPPSACFQNLTILKVYDCRGLLRLVSSSTAKSLVGLKEMSIQTCYMMTKVVADDEGAITEDEIINFSKLKSLELLCLSSLTSFCSWNRTFNFPSLERLSVQNCFKMKTFTSGVVLTPMLREIQLDNKDYYCEGDVNTSMQQIHEKLLFSRERLSLSLGDIKMILQKFPEHQFSKLKSLAVSDDESTVFPFEMLRQSHNLEQLKLADRSYKEILLCEEVEKQAETLAQLCLKELPTMSPCFQNLTDLSIRSCNNLKYLFSFSTLGSFVQLQDLSIGECKVLEAIIRIDELGNNVEYPCLKKLKIEGCPKIKAFIFNDKVSFPNLEEIRISNMINLEMIWQNQLTMDSMNAQLCQKLCKVDINSCKSLKKLFPPSIARNLFQLKDLYVIQCGIEEIVAKEGAEDAAAMTFGFPQLTCLKLQDVQELKCFYHGIHTIEWPVLKELILIGCDKIDQLFVFQKNILEGQLDIPVFSNLEKLSLDGNSNRMICQSQFPEILFPKLQHLEIKNKDDQPADLPLGIFQRSHNLESLSLEGGSNKEIFWFEVVGKHTVTKKLSISEFEKLEQIWKQDSKVDVILQNLEELDVSWCASLVTLIPPSACFQNLTILTVYECQGLLRLVSSSTAKTLVGLKEMRIECCYTMTKVVADDEGAVTEDKIINFSKLKSLLLFELPRLTSFCSWNYTFNFPSLETLYVRNCPKMKTFTSGGMITPMLREIELDFKGYYCEGDDVNTSMQQIHEKLVFSGERLSLNLRDIKMILQKFTEHQISKLKSLAVFDDESTVFPFEMIQRFHSLEELKLIDCSYQEIFLCEEVEKQAETCTIKEFISL
ncbi:hypothetical protein EZV62_004543 [Acer yangbiense]|uniref:AAA+ ATPase domain-containing protein n=1 Tax=Acer yangbiense TaxID=1000413 RepID=A0A5C7IK82_9ROSI|nr:hypothetical protein EZV62_004543 [Acer yangbiense]